MTKSGGEFAYRSFSLAVFLAPVLHQEFVGAKSDKLLAPGIPPPHPAQHPDIHEKLAAQGAEALTLTPGETAAYIRSEVAKWGKVVEASGTRVD